MVDVARNPRKGLLVDDGPHEGVELLHIPHLEFGVPGQQPFFDLIEQTIKIKDLYKKKQLMKME